MPASGAVGASYGDLLVTSLVVLGGVCLAALVIVRLAGRFLATGRARGGHVLDVVARLPLEPRRSLYIIEVAGKTLLVGTSEMGLSVLSELDGSEVRARAVARPSFGELVRSAWQRHSGWGARKASGHEDAGIPGDPTALDGQTVAVTAPVSLHHGVPGAIQPGRGDAPRASDAAPATGPHVEEVQ